MVYKTKNASMLNMCVCVYTTKNAFAKTHPTQLHFLMLYI